MKTTTILMVLLLTLSACTKFGKNVTVKGRVLNPITGEGIQGAEIKLQKTTAGLPGGYKTVKSTTTNAEGYFEISKASLRKLDIVCHTPLYQIGWHENGEPLKGQYRTSVKKGKVMNLDYYAVPYGDYQLIVNNVNCQGPNDTIIINQTNQVGSFLGIDWVLTGCDGYITSVSQAPSGAVYTQYEVIRNGVSTFFNDTFYINADQLNVQTINY